MESASRTALGRVVGKYTLTRLIGKGGMATVYEGVHRNANRVAIKLLNPEYSIDPELRARFLREGYVANTVGHRGVVRVIDDDTTDDDGAFLVMDLLDGETVDARAERLSRLSLREALAIAYRVLDVLAAAHAKGIIHRDIKPENLFVTTEGELMVLDFGIARIRDQKTAMLTHTRTGRMVGTPAFLPPEQALGRSQEIDARTDVWAVGATLFFLLTGELVHEAASVSEMLVYSGSRAARPIGAVDPALPDAVKEVVDRALRFARDERWQTASAMAEAVKDAYANLFSESLRTTGSFVSSDSPVSSTRSPATISSGNFAALSDAEQTGPTLHLRAPESAAKPITTTSGVARPTPARPNESRRPRAPAAVAIAAFALFVVGLLGAIVAMQRPAFAPVGPATSNDSLLPTSPSSSPVATAAPMTSSAVALAGSVAPQGAPGPSEAPSVAPSPLSSPPHPSAADAARVARPPLPPPQQAGPKKNCDPPYTIDDAGHRVPKPECL